MCLPLHLSDIVCIVGDNSYLFWPVLSHTMHNEAVFHRQFEKCLNMINKAHRSKRKLHKM